METYRRLETPKLYVIFLAQTISDAGVLTDGALTSPGTSTQAIIWDATDVVVQALTNMTEDATGKFSYKGYAIPSTAQLGVWHWEGRGTNGSEVVTYRGSFEVKEQIA